MRMVLKMVAAVPLLLLLCFSAISSTDPQKECTLYAATGQDVTVPLSTTLANTDSLRWRKNDAVIFHKKASDVRIGKGGDITTNGSLRLSKVSDGNNGTYSAEIHDSNGAPKGTKTPIKLCVIDRPPKPTVTYKCSTDTVKFTCDVQPKDLTIQWLKNGVVLPKEVGKILTLKDPDQVAKDKFSCGVSNQASSVLSNSVSHNCVKPSVFPETVLGLNTWILVGIGGGVVLVLIIVVIVCCICTRRRKRMHLKEEGELRLAWTNEAQQQYQDHSQDHLHPHPQHQHHQHRQQQPAGHTGPRHHRSKPHQDQRRPRAPNTPNANPNAPQPQPSPRRPAQAPPTPGKVDEEQPPPLPQPRKKAAKTARV